MKEFSAFPHTFHEHMQILFHEHMQILLQCYTICSACAKMCMNEGHKKTAIICTDCADVCALTIKLHSGDSEFNEDMMELCAKVCDKCAEECSKNKAEHCQQCSLICKQCSDACRT